MASLLPAAAVTSAAPAAADTTSVADWLAKLVAMNKADRERVLEKFPPMKRARIERGLNNLDKLDPAERQRTLERFRRFSQLDQQHKTVLRSAIEEFHSLPANRRPLVLAEINAQRAMTKEQREQRFSSDTFKSRFTSEERSIIERTEGALPNF